KIPNSALEEVKQKNTKNLTHLNEVLDQTWENIETAILATAKKQKLTTESERAKSMKIKGFVQRHAEIIILEQRKMLTSFLEKPFNKVILDCLLVKKDDQNSLATKPEEVRKLAKDFFQKQFYQEGVESNVSNSRWDEEYFSSVRIEEH
ncbi:31639_t:CDS:2, partial [Gigaspora margarita]